MMKNRNPGILPARLAVLCLSLSVAVSAPTVLDVPWSKQSQAWGCGQNSVRMILGYWGDRTELATLVLYTGPRGTESKIWKKVFADHFGDYELKGIDKNPAAVRAAIDAKTPVLCAVNAGLLPYLDYGQAAGHFIVLVGYDDEKKTVFLRDPNSKWVESMTWDELEKAWAGDGYDSLAIRKKTGAPADRPAPFTAEAKPFGAEKKAEDGFNILPLVPSVHVAAASQDGPDLGDGLARMNPSDLRLHARVGGLSWGRTAVTTAPHLQAHARDEFGLSAGWDFGRKKFLFSQGPSLSPDPLPQHRDRVFTEKDFSSSRKIPGKGTGPLKVDLSGHWSSPLPFAAEVQAAPGLVLAVDGGARLGGRVGLTPSFGDLVFGASYEQATYRAGAASATAPGWAADLAVGPFFGAFSRLEAAGVLATAWSAGLDLNVEAFSFRAWAPIIYAVNGLNAIGLGKSRIQFDGETHRLDGASLNAQTLRWSLQAPVDLVYLKLVWGLKQSWDDPVNAGLAPPRTELGATIVLNPFMPWFQVQAGYRYAWKQRDPSHQIFLGLYAGTGS